MTETSSDNFCSEFLDPCWLYSWKMASLPHNFHLPLHHDCLFWIRIKKTLIHVRGDMNMDCNQCRWCLWQRFLLSTDNQCCFSRTSMISIMRFNDFNDIDYAFQWLHHFNDKNYYVSMVSITTFQWYRLWRFSDVNSIYYCVSMTSMTSIMAFQWRR